MLLINSSVHVLMCSSGVGPRSETPLPPHRRPPAEVVPQLSTGLAQHQNQLSATAGERLQNVQIFNVVNSAWKQTYTPTITCKFSKVYQLIFLDIGQQEDRTVIFEEKETNRVSLMMPWLSVWNGFLGASGREVPGQHKDSLKMTGMFSISIMIKACTAVYLSENS